MSIFDEINSLSATEIISALYLPLANDGKSYRCPLCNNGGNGGSGDGIKPRTNNKGFTKWKCFGCKEDFSNYDLIAAVYGTTGDHVATIEQAKKLFGYLDDSNNNYSFKGNKKIIHSPAENIKDSAPNKHTEIPRKSYSKFYSYAQSQLPAFIKSCGGSWRGLTLETLQRFKCGYVPMWGKFKTPRLIIPTNEFQGLARLTVPIDKLEVSDSDKKAIRPKQHFGAEKEIFVARAVADCDYSVITEGAIDAMSIWQASEGKITACAVGGAGKYEKLLDNISIFSKDTKFVVLFDNDDTGKNNSAELIERLRNAGFKAASFLLDETAKVDSNDLLQCDEGALKERILEIIETASKEFEQMAIEELGATEVKEVTNDSGVEVMADVFDGLDAMTEKLKGDLLKWGFPVLDEKLPMLPGCYLLGALPSLGKTTLALNVAANVCEQGAAVLYISYEPTKNQIAVKDLASYWFKKVWNNHKTSRHTSLVPTATQIMLGRYSEFFTAEEMKAVREELKSKRRNFYFLQGRKDTAKDLISKIKPYVDKGVRFIVIDYIQLIQGADSSKSMREQIDSTIKEFQQFQAENDLVILFISSFNRENYRKYVCIESFKESGGLEYTADGILALQFKFTSGESRDSAETFQKKKQAQPRDMELVGLKNRFGVDFVDEFAYHSAHETFIEKSSQSKDNEPFCND